MAKGEAYRLQALLQVRERKKQDAETYLGQCTKNLKIEVDRQKDMELELQRMIAKREAKKREYAEKAMRGEQSAQGAVSANLYIERLKEQEENQKYAIEDQKQVVAQREEELEGARKDLIAAQQELKALEKHKEKWEEERRLRIKAKQEEQQDEIGQTIFLGRDRK